VHAQGCFIERPWKPVADAGDAVDWLFENVTLGSASRPYFLCDASTAKKLVALHTASGWVTPNMTASGALLPGSTGTGD
jgi:hypothetical protein